MIATTKSTDLTSEVASIQKIVHFLGKIDQKEQVANSNEAFVDRLDKICFCFFLFIDILYIIIVVIVTTRTDICKPQKMIIFDKEDYYTPVIYPFYNDTYNDYNFYNTYDNYY